MEQIFQTSLLTGCADKLDLCYRIRFYFMVLSWKISPMEDLMQLKKKLLKLRKWQMPMSLLQECRMDIIRWWEKEVLHFPVASDNVSASPVHWCEIRRFLFLTNQLLPSIRNLKKLF